MGGLPRPAGIARSKLAVWRRIFVHHVPFSCVEFINNRLTASALSSSDRGNRAIISRAAAKPSEPSEPVPGSEPLGRAFSVELVQPVVQPAESIGVSPDGLSLGIVDDLLGVQEVAGSNPVSPTYHNP